MSNTIPKTDDKIKNLREFVETEIVETIKSLVNRSDISEAKVQEMAKFVLNLIRPNMTEEELYNSIVKLDDNYPELSPIVYKIMKKYEEEYEKKAIGHISSLIKNGQFNEAENMIKKVLIFKMQ